MKNLQANESYSLPALTVTTPAEPAGSLPIATTAKTGVVKIGAGLAVQGDGTLSSAYLKTGSGGSGTLVLGLANNTNDVSGGATCFLHSTGSGNVIATPVGQRNLISGTGSNNSISGLYTSDSRILGTGSNNSIAGSNCVIDGGSGNTLTANHAGVTLIDCTNFTPPTSPQNVTYLRNAQLVTGGGSIQNSLSPASATAAPSVDAVTNGLALKYDKPTGVSVALGVGAYTPGGYCTNLGNNAGAGTTGGFGSVFIGTGAGYKSNPAGGIFIGQNACLNHTTGDDNLLIGRYVGTSFISGIRNIAFGYMAGPRSVLNNTVALGNNVVPTANGVMCLGGAGGDTYNVGIGPSAPTERLQVEGNIEASGSFILKSPNGTRYKLTISDAGNLETSLA
ncbi:hypothetical protein AUC43_15355 [Hymenobacter sedentarius]|uniref:Uncharacterized protein n=1 Tax=Hymenobacter sedentarius TaxID=1411621 RepID=A0A0U3SJN7_9BACT|nr:hypothetical protein [Hymenobacter sedentarius]ALW86340.1 hypothetical protein AUC43_15355 [Hymenobacter sedentarius]